MRRVGFLSFGHWQPVPGSQTRTARDASSRRSSWPSPPRRSGSTAPTCGFITSPASSPRRFRCSRRSAARTSRIEIGTAVIDMRYENPLYMAEDAAAADLISDGRLQLGISRGSPEPALRGSEAFGYVPAEDETDADMARAHTGLFRAAIDGCRRGGGRPADDRLDRSALRSSRSRPALPTGSGGAPARARPASGPPGRG